MFQGTVFEGGLSATGLTFGIVVSRWNDFITKALLDGALDALKRHGAEETEISVAWVPGSFEIPLALQILLDEPAQAGIVIDVENASAGCGH